MARIIRILPSLLVVAVMALASCTMSKSELQDAIDKANKELAGQFLGDGCYCDGVALDGNEVVYTYSFPGQEVGENGADDADFETIMKPEMKSAMKELAKDPDGKIFLDATADNNCGLRVVMKFDDRSYSVYFTPEEVKAFSK